MITGAVILALVSAFIVISCGATLHQSGIRIETAKEAAIALQPLAGKYAAILFAIGFLNASIFAASILPISTSYVTCESLGFEAGVDKTYNEAPVFYWLYATLIVIGSGFVLIPGINLIKVMLLSQVLYGILLPFLLLYMLRLCNDRRLMGEYTNSKLFNVIAWVTIISLVGMTAFLVVNSVMSLFRG